MGEISSKYNLDLTEAVNGLREMGRLQSDLTETVKAGRQAERDMFKKSIQTTDEYNKNLLSSIQINKKVENNAKAFKDELKRLDIVYEQLIRDQAKFISSGDYSGLKKKIEELRDRQKQLRGEMDLTGKSSSQMGMLAGKAAGTLAGLFAVDRAIRFGEQILEVTGEFEKLRAVLTNTLGSEVAAGKALEDIAVFAAKTPFSVREIASEFTKLANRDITPTIAQLTKMGDVAGTLGKPLGDVNEAILDVSNTERWNELGIKVKSSGDKMSGTFRGLTVEVAKTEKGALEMIERFGELPGVAGQMAAVSNTLTGQISNLGDSFDQLLLAIGSANSEYISGFISGLSSLLQGVTSILSKSQQEKNEVQLQSVKANLDEARSGEQLLNRYKELTKDGLELNKDERAELNGIALKLGETFGRENLQLNENTGLWEVNTKAIEQAIKAKFLLANQEASSLALRAKAIEEQRAQIQKEIDFADASVVDIEAKIGLSGRKLINQLTFALSQNLSKDAIGARFGITEAQIDFAKANLGKLAALGAEVDKQNAEQFRLSEEYVQIFDKLKNDFGFSEEEFNKLFNPDPVKETTKAIADNSKEVEKLREAYKKLIKDLELNAQESQINLVAAIIGEEDGALIERRARLAKERLITQFEEAKAEIEKAGKAAGVSRTEINVRLNILEEDYFAQFDTITQETQNKLKELEEKRAKEKESRRKEQAAKELLNINQAAEVEENTRVKTYGEQLDNLQASLRNKDISIKTYHAKRKALEESFQIEDLQSQVYYLEQQLSLASLSAEERYKIEKELVNKKKQLFDEEAANVSDPKKSKGWAALFGIDPSEADEFNKKMVESAQIIKNVIGDVLAAEIEANQQRIDSLTGYIAEKENSLENELKLNEQGFASNVEGKRKEIEELQKQRQKAINDQRRAQRLQLIIDSTQQASAMITSSAKIFSALSGIPFVGVPLAIGLIATMFGAFIAAKAKAFGATQPPATMRKGGILEGPSHEQGGIKGTGRFNDVEVEGKEYIINRKSTSKYLDLIEAINKDDLSRVAFPVYMPDADSNISPRSDLPKRLNKLQAKANEQEKQEQRQLQADLKEVKVLLKEIALSNDRIPEEQVIQTDEGILYLSKNKRRLVRKINA